VNTETKSKTDGFNDSKKSIEMAFRGFAGLINNTKMTRSQKMDVVECLLLWLNAVIINNMVRVITDDGKRLTDGTDTVAERLSALGRQSHDERVKQGKILANLLEMLTDST
jgi:hypothetical protein